MEKKKEKVRVLHLVEELKIGGLEKVIFDLSTKIDNKKYKVSVCCINRGGPFADELIKAGIDVNILRIGSYHNPINILKFLLYLKKIKPQIIHSHTYFSGTFGRIAGSLIGIPVKINHVHNTYWDYKKRHSLIYRRTQPIF